MADDLFPGAQVIIIDDKPEEAWPMAEAFSKLEIPVAWYKGTGEEDFPSEPLHGVRLLLLDLVLNPPSFDANYAAGAVFNTIAPTLLSGPFAIVLWTSHPDEKQDFMESLDKYNSEKPHEEKVIPIAILDMNKNDFGSVGEAKEAREDFDAERLIVEVKNVLKKLPPFDILIKWETSCSNAARRSVSRLSSLALMLAEMNKSRWGGEVEKLMDWLASAAGGKPAISDRTSETYIRALFESLAMIHDDAIRSLALSGQDSPLQADTYIDSPDNLKAKAALNTILLTERSDAGDMPGAVLLLQETSNPNLIFHGDKSEKPYRRYLSCIFVRNYTRNKKLICESCVPVLVEVSPSCDFAQNKRKRLRFVVGLLVPVVPDRPDNLCDLLPEHAGYIKRIGPVMYDNKTFELVLDSLHFFSVPLDQENIRGLPNPIFRLRSHVLVDIQAWLGRHLSRPGHLSIEAD
ncbi:hypothetical protein [Desulfovulcanus sp.]